MEVINDVLTDEIVWHVGGQHLVRRFRGQGIILGFSGRSSDDPRPLADVTSLPADPEPRSAWWAIGDLEDRPSDDVMTSPPDVPENQVRVDWLFDEDEHDSPSILPARRI